MNVRLFWKALLVQALLVGGLFALLVALPLPKDFFRDFGVVTGPLAWILCSIGTSRILRLPLGFVAFAALAGGVAGLLVSLASTHLAGMIAAMLVFAASCGSYEPETVEESADAPPGGAAATGATASPGATAPSGAAASSE